MTDASSSLPVLQGTNVALRPVAPADIARLTEILAEPSISRWWGRYDADKARAELLGDDLAAFVIETSGGEVVGCIQYYEENEPDYRHASIDIFVATEHQGRGVGTDALRTLAAHLFAERAHHRLTIDPATSNERAISAYRKVGFQPVGVMRRYERGPDGQWRDALLMDLLREDLG
jgi:aminoglycoside 6'-N-acetyltransferase